MLAVAMRASSIMARVSRGVNPCSLTIIISGSISMIDRCDVDPMHRFSLSRHRHRVMWTDATDVDPMLPQID
jgi:hypothetical protein